jgi:hypothetical protein
MAKTNLEKKQIDLIRESICVYTKCMECRVLFKSRALGFTNIEDFVDDRGRSCLFRLKEMCHELFRNSNDATYKEKLYDITVGYIFHEAMKLREDLYQLEYSRNRYDIVPHELTSLERKIVREIDILVKRAEKRLKGGLKEVRVLLMELMGQLKDLIVIYKNNYLLPRFIIENEKSLVRIYGKKGFLGLLNDTYQDGRSHLVYRAALSYLESEYYDLARTLFQKVLNLDAGNRAALFLYLYASANHFYLKSMFKRALVCAERAAAVETNDASLDAYREPLRILIGDCSKEAKRISGT